MLHFATFRPTISRFAFGLLLSGPLLLAACKKDKEDPKPENQDNELITTLRYTLTPVGGGTPVFVQFRDADGDGGAAPVITSTSADGKLTLRKGLTYNGRLLVLDESKTPADTVSNEVKEEADEHLFVFAPTPAALLNVTITDRDANSLPLGLETSVQTQTAAGSGNLQITLRHQPGVKNGTAAPGDTDIEVTFPVVITN